MSACSLNCGRAAIAVQQPVPVRNEQTTLRVDAPILRAGEVEHSADAQREMESRDLPIPAIALERNFSAKAELSQGASAPARVSPREPAGVLTSPRPSLFCG